MSLSQHGDYDDAPRYDAPESIDKMGIFISLTKLHLFKDDMHLRSQAHNLSMVDGFIMDLEYKVLHEWFETDRTPPLTYFLSAQSQMWIFAAYELLRTWKQRTKEFVKWSKNGGLEQKLQALKIKNYGYVHYGLESRIKQIESIIRNPGLISEIEAQQLHLYVLFGQLEYIRVSIAKHEISGKEKSIALMPGYGRINQWCGSLDYQFENGRYIMGQINRRDIAESIRHLDLTQEPPTSEVLCQFDDFMSGKNFQDLPPI